MSTPTHANTLLSDFFEPLADALTPESAKLLASLKVSPSVQRRIDELAAKCNQGEMTEPERQDYEEYVRVGNVLAVLKAKAKAALATKAP